MRMTAGQARERFLTARVARLATVTPGGAPHLVPVVYAVDGDELVFTVDGKPKSTTALQRLTNIAGDPRVCLLADEYAEDWSTLWWARADGRAQVGQLTPQLRDLLTARYPQYRATPPPGPAVVVTVERWTGWSAASP